MDMVMDEAMGIMTMMATIDITGAAAAAGVEAAAAAVGAAAVVAFAAAGVAVVAPAAALAAAEAVAVGEAAVEAAVVVTRAEATAATNWQCPPETLGLLSFSQGANQPSELCFALGVDESMKLNAHAYTGMKGHGRSRNFNVSTVDFNQQHNRRSRRQR
jgi:hypothetical protein